MNKVQIFRELHHQNDILQIGNVWDVQSALSFEQQGYKALGTSSAAIADTLGLADGEQMSFDELFSIVHSITQVISIPLSVDLEAGYNRDPKGIIENIMRLADIGVVGVNLEDTVVDTHSNPQIIEASLFSHTLSLIKKGLKEQNCDIFLNVRTDSFLVGLDNPLEDSIHRASLYEKSGADGLFVPCIVNSDDIKQLVDSISIPVNIMAMPNLPDFSEIKALGVKRLSTGPSIYNQLKNQLKENLKSIEENQSFMSLF